jgi:Spy/CpxP family protein refolding chaperone
MTRLCLLAGFATTVLANPGYAQSAVITGKVRSTQGQNLHAANVRIANFSVSVGTSEHGVYRFVLDSNRVRGQTVTLSARAVGYKPEQKEVTLRPGQYNIDFALEFDANRVSEVVVFNAQDTARTKTLAFTVDKGGNVTYPPSGDFSQHLYPPELIMQNQRRLGITESQREAILQEIYKVQATAAQVQWRVSDESEKLNQLLERENAPESEVLAQADRMMSWEVAVKRAQLTMLIRIRNLLTPEQKAMLAELRRRE